MTIGSGLAGSLGLAPEVTYGTYQAPTRFVEITKVDLKERKTVKQGGGLAAGRFAQSGTRRVVTGRDATGSIEMEVPNRGFGLLLQHLFGGSAAPVQQGATTAYLQTHPMADNIGKMLTAQVGVPDVTGVVRPHTYLGCKVLSAEFSCGVDEELTCKLDLDSWGLSESQALAAPSYTTGLTPFHFAQMGFKWGTFGAEAAVTSVRKVTLKVERGQRTDRRYANAGVRKAEPIMNDWVKVSGSIDTDYVDKTIFADRYAADGSASMIWEFVGPAIAGGGTNAETIRFRVPMTFLDGDTPTLDGPDVVSPTFTFVGQFDGTNSLVTGEYMSLDTAV